MRRLTLFGMVAVGHTYTRGRRGGKSLAGHERQLYVGAKKSRNDMRTHLVTCTHLSKATGGRWGGGENSVGDGGRYVGSCSIDCVHGLWLA